jgi:2-oxoglutarate ferredoxin oxidoreductase subunit alpha
VLSWGSVFGAAYSAVSRFRARRGTPVAHVHLRYLNPFPKDLGEILARYERVLIPELNAGQLALLIRSRYLVDAIAFPKLQGQPFTISEVEAKIEEVLS